VLPIGRPDEGQRSRPLNSRSEFLSRVDAREPFKRSLFLGATTRNKPTLSNSQFWFRRHSEQFDFTRMLASIPLQGSEVVAISKLREKVFQDSTVAFAGNVPICTFEMIFQVLMDFVVVNVLSTSIRKTTGCVVRNSKRRGAGRFAIAS
jgi:hypothetical protein